MSSSNTFINWESYVKFHNQEIIQLIYRRVFLKGLSHEIFIVIFWLEWIHIVLKGNRFWFLNFKDVSSVLDSDFKF
jgi:hypothetical protein